MGPYHLRYRPRAEKDLAKLPTKDRLRVTLAISALSLNPFIGKKLDGKYTGFYSLRVWPYRIIYYVYKKELLVLVIRIGHRQGVY